MIQLGVTTRNARLDAIETAAGTAPKMQLFSGALPANCAAADSGTKLVDTALPSDWMAAAAAGSKAKSGTWSLTGAAAGKARHFRLYDSAGTTCHMQGLCGANWAASTAVVLNQHVINDGGKVYVCTTAGTTAAAGGPTGTGSGIADGTAVWNYVGTADMTLDNTDIAVSQTVTVSTFTLTDGGA